MYSFNNFQQFISKHFFGTDGAGPRFDKFGRIVPHSILGDAFSYQKQAIETGNWPEGAVFENPTRDMKVIQQKKKERKIAFEDENKALENWDKKMKERRKQQGYLSSKLQFCLNNKRIKHVTSLESDFFTKFLETIRC